MCTGKRILANDEGFGRVAECGCGTIHLTIGAVTLALDVTTLRRLYSMVGAAINQQRQASDDDAQTASILAEPSRVH